MMTREHMKTFFLSLDQVAEVLGTSLSGTRKEGYWFTLQDLSLEAFQGACQGVMREETFFPVPAIFRTYAKEWMQKQRRSLEVPTNGHDLLALREELITPDEVRDLIASLWPDEPSQDQPPLPSILDMQAATERKALLLAQARQLQEEG